MIYQRWANMRYQYRNREFWCRGYYVDTVGKNTKKIKEYIANQLKEDQLSGQMIMEDFDPFKGQPVKNATDSRKQATLVEASCIAFQAKMKNHQLSWWIFIYFLPKLKNISRNQIQFSNKLTINKN